MKDRSKYLWTWVDHFQSILGDSNGNKKAINDGDALSQIFKNWNSSYLKSDNGKEFTNQKNIALKILKMDIF